MVNPILAKVIRSGLVESVHRGRLAVTNPDGELKYSFGEVQQISYPRSANKPFQALAMLELGLELEKELLALASASHSGEDFHLQAVKQILSETGLTPSQLQNTPDYPLDDQAKINWIAAGNPKTSLTQNCSGKHAAMLRTCQHNGWPIEHYLDQNHPLQQKITAVITQYAGVQPQIGIDGCGAPAHTMTMTALARSYGRLAAAAAGPAKQIAEVFRNYPEYVSGTQRWEAKLHQEVAGLICKCGAEAVFAIGLPTGHGIAIKLDDGSSRALPVIAVAALQLIGITSPALTQIGTVSVLGHGQPVGQIISELTTTTTK